MKKTLLIAVIALFANYAQGQVTNGLVAKYSFNNGDANDESGNSNHGTINGATLTSDRFGNANKAFMFAQNQTITVPDIDTLDGMTNEMTISFWVQAPTIISNSNNLISKFSFCGGGADAYNIRINSDGKIWAQIDDQGGFDSWQTGSITVADSSWHHVVLVWNKPNVMIFVDGVADTSGSYTDFNSTVSNSPEVLAFGHVVNDFCGSNYEYSEKLDDIRIYNVALDQSKVDSLFNEVNPMIVGLNEPTFTQNSVVIYPNPTTGLIFLSSNYHATLIDITGKVILKDKYTNTVDISNQPTGMYFLLLTDNNGQIVQRSKVIKE